MPRVVIIGLDGASWRLFEPWARAGRLPHLATLMARGAWGPLRSTVPALTLPAWGSFMTGRNPGAHGLFAFRRPNAGGYGRGRLANATDLRSPTLWDAVARGGQSVGVISVPPSYPLPRVTGYVVGCMLTPPGAPVAHPPELADALAGYQVDVEVPAALRRRDADLKLPALGYLEGLREQTRTRAETTVRLMRTRPTDLVCVVFYAPDRVQHYFWHAIAGDGDVPSVDADVRTAALAVYDALDEAIGQIAEAAGADSTIVLVSDHGFTDTPERAVRVNRWLADHGFLHQRAFWTARRRVIRTVLPAAWRARYDTIDGFLLDRARSQAWAETIEPRTVAVWLHVADRYPLGCVAPGAEYETLRSRIQAGLAALRDEDGSPVFRGVHRREDLYRGAHVAEAPDLIGLCTQRYGVVFESLNRDLRQRALFGPFDEAGYSGTHEDAGLYLFAGPAIAARGAQQPYGIESIAPTVLHLLGLPVPDIMEGPVCTDLLDADGLRREPVRFDRCEQEVPADAPAGWGSAGEEALIADHLRALGYLE